MAEDFSWGWNKLRLEIFKFFERQEWRFQQYLPLIKECDEIAVKIINRPLSPFGSRPQDFVTASLTTRSFRLFLTSLLASFSGYGDSSPVLLRPLYEIGIRLLQIEKDPIPASYGYLLSGVKEEIKIGESWFQHLNNSKQASGNMENNLQNLKDYVQAIEKEIQKHGLSAEKVLKEYGKISVKTVSKKLGIEDHFYDVSFGFMSGYTHERGFGLDDYSFEMSEVRVFQLGPIYNNPGSIMDTFHNLLRNLITAASIVDKENLKPLAVKAYQKLKTTFPVDDL
jgi:hypothetical protein